MRESLKHLTDQRREQRDQYVIQTRTCPMWVHNLLLGSAAAELILSAPRKGFRAQGAEQTGRSNMASATDLDVPHEMIFLLLYVSVRAV